LGISRLSQPVVHALAFGDVGLLGGLQPCEIREDRLRGGVETRPRHLVRLERLFRVEHDVRGRGQAAEGDDEHRCARDSAGHGLIISGGRALPRP